MKLPKFLRKCTNTVPTFPYVFYKNTIPVCNMWNKGIIFVKIFWWHKLLEDFLENICFRQDVCANISYRVQLDATAWKNKYFYYFRENRNVWTFSRQRKFPWKWKFPWKRNVAKFCILRKWKRHFRFSPSSGRPKLAELLYINIKYSRKLDQ